MSLSYIDYEGVSILLADYRQCSDSFDQLLLLEKVAEELEKQESPIPLLVDYRGVDGSSGAQAYMKRITELGDTVFKKHRKCAAILGITGMKKLMFNSYLKATGSECVRCFNDKAEAFDWLVNFQEVTTV
ncbi:hypothetical protein [Reichenbachiella versicolor]|uniref:hypothetical protein n=1 Tax=Reichenbachiella versicolor TaxID=1821036 RepID=UPI000D6E1A0D|nr:hypothetical protein [Reichenbachiella versicolor]